VLLKYTKSKAFDTNANTDLLDLHRELIKSLSTRLNALKYALITISVSRQFAELDPAVSFLE
jgi:hypothetical protein